MTGVGAAGAAPATKGPICGMTWGWPGIRGTWDTPAARESMRLMTGIGVNWTAIAYAAVQPNAQSTEIPFRSAPTVTDDEIRRAIRDAKAHGLRVCLKPVVNCADGTWRAYIGFFDWDVPGEPNWAQWFSSYTEFILHAARLAESEGCEMFCVGCEMVRADGQERRWRELIARVREVYSGTVTYNCDKYQEDHLRWWDALDVISSSGYYPIDSWEAQLDRIARVVTAAGKPFFFMEAGCPSRTGSADLPNDWALPGEPSMDEQVRYYRVMFDACRRRDWVGGFMLWDWPAQLYAAADAGADDDYCVFAKPAEHVVRDAYLDRRGVDR